VVAGGLSTTDSGGHPTGRGWAPPHGVRPFLSWRERVSGTPCHHPRPTSADTPWRAWGNLSGVQFEVEVYQNEVGDWVATAVAYNVTVTGRTEKEALARVMEALAGHFKRTPK
jgi:hypothetical protein